jgi:hypothetical protein
MLGSVSTIRWTVFVLIAGFLHAHAETQPLETLQFSADLVRVDAAGAPLEKAGKLYADGNNIRIETPDFPGDYFLVDTEARTSYFIQSAQRAFMEARLSSPLALVFLPLDPDNPCPAWQAQAERALARAADTPWRCERVGEETVGGRRAIEFRVVPQQRHLHAAWIDPELRMPIRMTAAFGSAELVNIKPGAPAAGLFKVPAHFRRFDPLRLIERIKQSDVWVELPPP